MFFSDDLCFFICPSVIQVDVVVGLESRGFVFGPMIAQKLNVSFVPVRKAGKLPGETTKVTYSLEYGQVRRQVELNLIILFLHPASSTSVIILASTLSVCLSVCSSRSHGQNKVLGLEFWHVKIEGHRSKVKVTRSKNVFL